MGESNEGSPCDPKKGFGMRRKHSEVKEPEKITEILSKSLVGRLATFGADGFPYITPVNYVLLDGNIYFHSAPEGEKLENMRRDSRVCFQVDIPLAYLDLGFDPAGAVCSLHQFYHCVIVRGNAREVPPGPLKLAALNALVAKHEPGVAFTPVTEDMPSYRACAVVEITPVCVSCKSDLAQNKPQEQRSRIAAYLLRRNRPGDRETAAAMGFSPES